MSTFRGGSLLNLETVRGPSGFCPRFTAA